MYIKSLSLVLLILLSSCSTSTTYYSEEGAITICKIDSSLIRINNLYTGWGKLLDGGNCTKIRNSSEPSISAPSMQELSVAERCLLNYCSSHDYDTTKTIQDFKHYYRQYLKFIMPNGDTIIIINLVKYKQLDAKSKKEFYDEMIEILSQETYNIMHYVNISTGEINNMYDIKLINEHWEF